MTSAEARKCFQETGNTKYFAIMKAREREEEAIEKVRKIASSHAFMTSGVSFQERIALGFQDDEIMEAA